MSSSRGRTWGICRIVLLIAAGLLLIAGVAAPFSSFALKWLLSLGPVVVGLAAAIGFVGIAGRVRTGADAGARSPVVLWLLLPVATVVGLIAAVGFVAMVGALLPRSHLITRSARFAAPPERVWALISDFDTQRSWRPGLRSMQRLPDRNGHAVWNVVGSAQPGIPSEFEVFELEISAFAVWLTAPARRSLVDAEEVMKDLHLEIAILQPTRRMRSRVLNDNIPCGGAWTWELSLEEGKCRVRITEEGFVESALLRYLACAAGYTNTMEAHLRALGLTLGEPTRIDP